MILSVRSCSLADKKILVHVMAQLPSAFGAARVRIRPRSVPQCGSVRFMVPPHSPEIIFGRYFSFCSRSEEHTSELQSLMRISYAVFCLKKKNKKNNEKQCNI